MPTTRKEAQTKKKRNVDYALIAACVMIVVAIIMLCILYNLVGNALDRNQPSKGAYSKCVSAGGTWINKTGDCIGPRNTTSNRTYEWMRTNDVSFNTTCRNLDRIYWTNSGGLSVIHNDTTCDSRG